MTFSVEFFIYLVAGVAILALYYVRRKGLDALKPESMPELDKLEFMEFKRLLATAYERTLYLGVSFLLLAYTTARASEIKSFAVILTVGLVLYNIPPRHKIMRILASAQVDLKSLKQRGISL
jgi:hypothetical protein